MDEDTRSTGDPLPPNCELIEVRVAELQQLFNAMDQTTPQKSRQRPSGAIAVPERGPVATAAMDAFVPERESKTGKTTT